MSFTNRNYFALIDCNNFFASCEQVFNPKIRSKAVVILSNNDGCIISRSKEAKALGIKMGAPAFHYADFFIKHQVVILSSNFTLYGAMSARVMATLETFGFPVSIYSIDEAFITLPKLSLSEYQDLANAIKTRVKQWTGLPIAVGMAPTRTLAKAANEIAKKDLSHKNTLVLMENKVIDKVLEKMPVETIWGIGKNSKETLNRKGIYTALQLKNGPDDWLRKQLTIRGVHIAEELRGVSCLEDNEKECSKSMVSSRSFGKEVFLLEEVREAVAFHAANIGERLRKQNATCSHIGVFIHTNRFKEENETYIHQASLPLPFPSAFTPLLIEKAVGILMKVFKEGLVYKKAGVIVSEIRLKADLQFDFWQPVMKVKKQEDLMKTCDTIQHKFGGKALFYASEGVEQPWKARSNLRSPNYLNCWEEIPFAKASQDA